MPHTQKFQTKKETRGLGFLHRKYLGLATITRYTVQLYSIHQFAADTRLCSRITLSRVRSKLQYTYITLANKNQTLYQMLLQKPQKIKSFEDKTSASLCAF